ncbi:A/G-specific adenine glycosylase [Fulvivirga lutimaris]|uniref:A/G-specific adenine glycosylase n=1 Tax=Fulvivirga lutimaris TaxID=1819566 RepID=UPI0012BBBE1B|nr:A/G-specific adenine glycosylase [Fulvivirga lutimaris]MTI39568.1 A/G-specific adenine glycosylase [Fulvivirga lutimaris]
MTKDFFNTQILDWYSRNKRDLPWRQTRNPYHIWLSEIILQQTRVSQGLPYYLKFVNEYPTVHDLANADERDVLRVWQGLGYYSRARNLHKSAKIISENHDGNFPNTFKDLLKLPGIGNYTAAAIASIAFSEKVAVVDGNVYRVLSRVFGIDDDISSGKGQKVFQEKANELISEKHPDEFNQAIMEFGALQCVPKSPDCSLCPFSENCFAQKNGMQPQLPVKIKKVKVRKRYFNYIAFEIDGKLALKERRISDIWRGLYDFHLIETEQALNWEELLGADVIGLIKEDIYSVDESTEYKHILTHQRIFARFYTIKLKKGADIGILKDCGLAFYTLDEVLDLPKPVLVSTYLNETFF